jgi:nitrile hydratase
MADEAPDLAPGDPVRILDLELLGHVRTPRYARGRTGHVERYCGVFPNPEELAVGMRPARPVHLYRVRLDQRALWQDYDGAPEDTLDIEIYRHWLEPIAREGGADGR